MNTPELYEAHYSVPMAGMILNAMNYRLDHKTIAYIIDHSELKLLFVDLELLEVAKKAVEAGDKNAASEAFAVAQRVIDRLADKRIVHANKAARHKSRLSKAIRSMA